MRDERNLSNQNVQNSEEFSQNQRYFSIFDEEKDPFLYAYGEMDDDAFHYMMEHHNLDLFDEYGEIQDQIFYCEDVSDTNRKEKCEVQPLGDLLTQNPMERGIQSARNPLDCQAVNSTNAEKGSDIRSDQSDEDLFFDVGCGVTCEDFENDIEYENILKNDSITSNNDSLNDGIDQQARDDLIQDYFMAMAEHPELYDETIICI